ncbi:MAG: cytochrome c nitrite reductase small subunit [Prolixibacteraceae bacterium]|nr:cytochrome c nitrite reductase small subunit [Prolixibacteraceae bacterium]
MNRFVKWFMPPDQWKIPVILMLGIFTGIGLLVLHWSKAPSYLGDKPETCMNCHIMAPQYATWAHSSHRNQTHCNDCHVPHNNVVNKYYFKAKDGLRHATMFTLRLEPQVIFIHEAGQNVVQQNCIRCHEELLTNDKMLRYTQTFDEELKDKQCWTCHRETPHGRVNSLSSVPNARVPVAGSPVPEWIKKLNNQ